MVRDLFVLCFGIVEFHILPDKIDKHDLLSESIEPSAVSFGVGQKLLDDLLGEIVIRAILSNQLRREVSHDELENHLS